MRVLSHTSFPKVITVDAVGDGVADDTAAIQAAIDSSQPEDTIVFPGGDYLVSDTVVLLGGRRYQGSGGRQMLVNIVAAPGFAGDAVLAAEGWIDSAAVADEPISIDGIRIDCNDQSGVHGLVVYNFWSHFRDIQVVQVNGSAAWAILATDRGSNGVTTSANSHSENTFERIRIDDCAGGAGGFRAESYNGISNQDGHIMDSFFAGVSGISISLGRASGWTIENNHLYACGDNAIDLLNCYATKVIGNYIEDFGVNNVTTGPTGGYYTGINLATVLDGKPSIVANNTITHPEPDTVTANRWTCLGVRAGSGQTFAHVSIVGNAIVLDNTPTGNNAECFRIGEGGDSGRVLTYSFAGNSYSGRGTWENFIEKENGTTRLAPELVFVRGYTGVTGTITLDSTNELVQNFTCTGDVTVNPPSAPLPDGTPLRMKFLASGAQRIITFNSSIRLSTGIASRAFTVPSGEVAVVALEYSTLVADWIITAGTVSAN